MASSKFLLLSFVLFSTLFSEPLRVQVKAPCAILINAQTGAILFEKNGREAVSPASTTKVATALYALHLASDRLDQEVRVPGNCLSQVTFKVKEARGFKLPPYWLEPDGTSFGLKRGDVTTLRSLLYGLMLASGNDAANVIAYFIGQDIPHFVKGMNHFVKELGCQNTHFDNPHGLYYPTHKTCAYDLALIAKEALKYPLFREVVKTLEYECPLSKRYAKQPNRLLKPGKFYYDKAIGVKSGYIANAGYCFVAAAEDETRTLISVVLGCKESFQRYRDVLALFDAAFAEKQEMRRLYKAREALFKTMLQKKELIATLKSDINYHYYPSEESALKSEVQWTKKNLPVRAGEEVGKLLIQDERGQTLFCESLYAEFDLHKPSFIWILWFILPSLALPVLIIIPRKLRWFFN